MKVSVWFIFSSFKYIETFSGSLEITISSVLFFFVLISIPCFSHASFKVDINNWSFSSESAITSVSFANLRFIIFIPPKHSARQEVFDLFAFYFQNFRVLLIALPFDLLVYQGVFIRSFRSSAFVKQFFYIFSYPCFFSYFVSSGYILLRL